MTISDRLENIGIRRYTQQMVSRGLEGKPLGTIQVDNGETAEVLRQRALKAGCFVKTS